MDDGESKNWTRFCHTVAGYYATYSNWPSHARLEAGSLQGIEEYGLTVNQWQRVNELIRFETSTKHEFMAFDGEGREYRYDASRLAGAQCLHQTLDWLLGPYRHEEKSRGNPALAGLLFSADGSQVAGPPADPKTVFDLKAHLADFTFVDLLDKYGIDCSEVIVMRHAPQEPQFAKQFTWIVEHREDVFIAYQQVQDSVEKQMLQKQYLAGFVASNVGEAIFGGLYRIGAHRRWSRGEFEANRAFSDLTYTFNGYKPGTKNLVFELDPVVEFKKYKGRLLIGWSGGIHGSRSWSRPGDSVASKRFPIFALYPKSVFADDKPTPDWREVSLSLEQMKEIPESWKIDFAQWRAIYLITDTSDGKQYVGCGGGVKNLWGRWCDYVATGHGGNKLLRKREPANFRFSILERVSPDLTPKEIVAIESNWKDRLHTRTTGLNDN